MSGATRSFILAIRLPPDIEARLAERAAVGQIAQAYREKRPRRLQRNPMVKHGVP